MYHSFLIHSSADGLLGCFHVLAIINSSAFFEFVQWIEFVKDIYTNYYFLLQTI